MQQVGPYEVTGELGRGGMGVVLRGRGPDGQAVAVKLLLRPRAGAVERFAREVRLLRELGAEQGFVPILDAGQGPQGPWLAMPLLEGGTLRDRLRGGALGLPSGRPTPEARGPAARGADGRDADGRDCGRRDGGAGRRDGVRGGMCGRPLARPSPQPPVPRSAQRAKRFA